MSTALDDARDLFDLVDTEARATEGEALSPAAVDALVEAGLHSVMVPAEIGGRADSLTECLDVFAEIARADGSTGWCLMATASAAAYFAAYCDDSLVDRMFGDGVPWVAGQFAPNGVARPTEGGWLVQGSYQFGSGLAHAAWAGAGVLTEVPEGENPDYLFGVVPVDQAGITGNWDVLGLEHTASWDYRLDDVFLAEDATFDFFGFRRRRGPAWLDLGVMPLTAAGHAGWALGVARRALDEVAALAHTKKRMTAATSMADSERFLHDLGHLESRYRAAEAWVRDTFARAEQAAMHGGADERDALLTRQATVFLTQEAGDLIRQLYLHAGTTGLRAGPLQQCFRDIHAGTQHAFASPAATIELGRALVADAAP